MIQPQPSVMSSSEHFSVVPKAEIERSTFDRSHGWKGTFDAGYLIPVLVDEMLPGDTFHCNMSAFARLATPLKAPMDNMFLDSFFFFVPNRLLWYHFREMHGQQANPTDSTDYEMPYVTTPEGGAAVGSLVDYMGVPTGVAGLKLRADFLQAYNLIWNEWFRDENLQPSAPVGFTSDGDIGYSNFQLLRRGKRKDYFTSALPWPQKGDAVTLPVGGHAPVYGTFSEQEIRGILDTDSAESSSFLWHFGGGGTHGTMDGVFASHLGDQYGNLIMPATSLATMGIYADLGGATAPQVNALRQAFQLQRLLERDARGGTRYTELIRSHFGVISPDGRLQRPEFLGGGETPVTINPVAQTTGSGGSGLGELAAFGTIAATGGHGFTYSATEHGVILGLVSVRADLTYQEGLDRMWSRFSRFDFYYPSLAHLGEQAILKGELYATGTATDAETWGYQERFAEYRYKKSNITSLFRSSASGTLDSWHLSQAFGSLPALGAGFIQDDPPVDRIIAVPTQPHFKFDAFFRYRCARPMPVYSVPGLIDHF